MDAGPLWTYVGCGQGRIRTADLRCAVPARYLLRHKPIVRNPRVERGVSCFQRTRVSVSPAPDMHHPLWSSQRSTPTFSMQAEFNAYMIDAGRNANCRRKNYTPGKRGERHIRRACRPKESRPVPGSGGAAATRWMRSSRPTDPCWPRGFRPRADRLGAESRSSDAGSSDRTSSSLRTRHASCLTAWIWPIRSVLLAWLQR
jgi:hypothetical protein